MAGRASLLGFTYVGINRRNEDQNWEMNKNKKFLSSQRRGIILAHCERGVLYGTHSNKLMFYRLGNYLGIVSVRKLQSRSLSDNVGTKAGLSAPYPFSASSSTIYKG